MSESQPDAVALLSLAEGRETQPVRSTWIEPIFALGTRLANRSQLFEQRQLIVAISVPSREFAAALIGSGWALSRPPTRTSTDPGEVLRNASPGESYRAVSASYVLSGQFRGLEESHAPPLFSLAGRWALDRFNAVAPIAEPDPAERMSRPVIGSIGRMAGVERDWEQRLVAPAADLAIVGTKSWISQDLTAVLARGDDIDGDTIETLLLPKTDRSATWFTRIYSSSRFAELLPLPGDVRAVILDGQGAIKYLNDILVPIVVCIFDRSVADESAAEQVVQLRNSRGEPVSLKDQLGWYAPVGVEALAFTVAL